jgi:3-deoxy-7-phosphoheptulonate synthase
MAVVLMFGGGVPVVKIGRMAGQFAKPRSADTETVADGRVLPSYRGDIINGPEETETARVPDPWRLVKAYNQSAATLNLLRGFATGGYAGLKRVMDWNLDFMAKSDEGRTYADLAARVDEAISFMLACGMDYDAAIMRETEFYVRYRRRGRAEEGRSRIHFIRIDSNKKPTPPPPPPPPLSPSHECLLLEYEHALTRQDSTTGLWYDCSGHFLWCGERTRQLDAAHIEFLRGVGNPLGVKVSDKMDPGDLVTLIHTLNPGNTPGRLAVIVRMGADNVRAKLPGLVEAVTAAGQVVAWVCDPMHGNTEACNGFKTRRYEKVRAEVEAFFDVHDALGTVPGGVHLEMTGDDVTECLGGGSDVAAANLPDAYRTQCDPRLNAAQALEMAFYVARRLRARKERLNAAAAEA